LCELHEIARMKKLLYLALFTAYTLTSCTLQKRMYSSGFHLEWPTSWGNAKSAKNHKYVDLNAQNATNKTSSTEINQALTPVNHSTIERRETFLSSNNEFAKNSAKSAVIPRHALVKNTAPQQLTTSKTVHKKLMSKKQLLSRNRPGDGLVDILLVILGIVAALLGYDSYDSGWGGGGVYIDWTVFFTVIGVCTAILGFLLTVVGGASMSPSSLRGMMGAFTIFATIFSGIGLIKSIRDYNDVCKFVSIGAFALLAIMWVVGLLMF
jgi:hypothetical protein